MTIKIDGTDDDSDGSDCEDKNIDDNTNNVGV